MGRYSFRFGHNELCEGANSKYANEVVEDRRYGKRIIELLREAGDECIDCTPPPIAGSGGELTYGTDKERSINPKCDLFLVFHVNAALIQAHGAETLISGTSSKLAYDASNRVLANLQAIGLTNRGVKCTGNEFNDIRESNAQAIIFEPFFLTNESDANIYKNNFEKFCRAIANGIDGRVSIEIPKLVEPDKQFKIDMFGHIENIGNVNVSGVNDCTIGTIGKGLRTEALAISIDGGVDIDYTIHAQDIGNIIGQAEGQIEGTMGQSKRIEAITINVKSIPVGYKLQYQTHVQNVGWQDWKKSGQLAGTTGQSLRLEALRVRIIKL